MLLGLSKCRCPELGELEVLKRLVQAELASLREQQCCGVGFFGGWFPPSPVPFYEDCIGQMHVCQVRIEGVAWCSRKGDAVSKWQKGVVCAVLSAQYF